MRARLDRLATFAGYALLTFTAGYLIGHVSADVLHVDALAAMAYAGGLFLAAVILTAAIFDRRPIR